MNADDPSRVKQFLEKAYGTSLNDFFETDPTPMLIAMGGIAKADDGFYTQAAFSIDAFAFSKIKKQFDPNARVFPVRKLPGANPYSQMIIIGRASNSDIHLQNSNVSKMHAYFTWADSEKGKTFQITDGNSHNGTQVNKQQLAPNKPLELESGDVIGLGNAIFMCFYYPRDFFSTLSRMNEE